MLKKDSRFAIITIFLINILNYTDRYILPAVLPQIKNEFHLSTFQEGILGTSFILVFALSTLPLSALADKMIRKNLIALFVTFWSFLTFLTGFAWNFSSLFVIRSLLGLGEAGYSPASLSLLSEYSEKEKLGKILSFFSAGSLIGAALGYAIGGITGAKFGWRYAFLIVGVPGIIFAIMAFNIKEKVKERQKGSEIDIKSILELFKIPSFIIVIAAYILTTFAVGALSFWLPSYIVEHFHLSLIKGGIYAGAVLIVSGTLGVTLGGWFSDFLFKKDKYTRFFVPIIACIAGTPFVLAAFLTNSLSIFIILTLIGGLFLSASIGPLYVIIHDITHSKVRSSAYGVSGLLSHLLGDAPAPAIVGSLAGILSLKFSILILTTVFLLAAGVVCMIGSKYIRKDTIS